MPTMFKVRKPEAPLERRTNKWVIREPESNFGYPTGRIVFFLPMGDDKAAKIEGYVTDCDGDGSSWTVYQDGVCVASGDVAPFYDDTKDPSSDFDQAVNEASYFIMTGKKRGS